MAEFHRADRTRLNVFPDGEVVRFRAYFDEPGLFASLRPFYDDRRYRFEVDRERFDRLADLLRGYGYEPVVVEDPTPFVVAHRRFRDHPKVLFRHAVERRRTDHYTLFLLNTREAVAEAIEAGAVAIDDLEGVEWRR
ncbi:MAG: hypothetical protein ACLFMX_03905 [Halobacteriales archaeon]